MPPCVGRRARPPPVSAPGRCRQPVWTAEPAPDRPPPSVATRPDADWRRRRRGPQVRQERGQADQSIARSASSRPPASLPARGLQPRTLRDPSMKRPGDPLHRHDQPSRTPRSHARVGIAPSACREHGYGTHQSRGQGCAQFPLCDRPRVEPYRIPHDQRPCSAGVAPLLWTRWLCVGCW